MPDLVCPVCRRREVSWDSDAHDGLGGLACDRCGADLILGDNGRLVVLTDWDDDAED